jgi:ATP-binding cassette subfamily B protein
MSATARFYGRHGSDGDARLYIRLMILRRMGTGGTRPRASAWSSLRPLLGDRRSSIVGLALSSVLSGITEAATLALVAQVAATLVDGAKRVHVDVGPLHVNEAIGTLLALALALSVVRLILQVPISLLPARIAAQVQARLRENLFDAFTRASWAVKSRDHEGHLQDLVTNQVTQAASGALQATALLVALLTFLVMVISALALNVAVALIVLAAAIALFALLRPLNALGGRVARALSQAQMNYAGEVGEAIRVAEETDVFGVAAIQRSQIDRLVARTRDLFSRTQLIAGLGPNVYQSLVYLILVAGLAAVYETGAGQFGSLGAVVLLLVRAGGYGRQFQSSYLVVRQTLPFVERVQDAERRYLASSPFAGAVPLTRVETLAFEDVSFAYLPDRPVLSKVSFKVAGGEAIGIVGPSGAGKSTLVQILLRLRAPDSGRYLVNGDPAEQFAREDWQRRVACVPQEPRLLHASVADNIRFLRDLDDAAVRRAARLAGIHEDVIRWSDGYDTLVGPRADAVSGGQQQRICLARALAAEPEILVLDEPTSALDPHSERLIQESLAALKGELTLFVVAHRMSTLDMCERVLVLVDGRLEAFDTVDRLRLDSSYYRSASALADGVSVAKS